MTDDGGNASPAPAPSYLSQLHLELIVALVAICAGLGVAGWLLRPQSGGFPSVPENIFLDVSGYKVDGVTETLTRTAGNGSVLDVEGDTSALSVPPKAGWEVTISRTGAGTAWLDGGRLCPPAQVTESDSARAVASVVLARQRVTHSASSVGSGIDFNTNIQSTGLIYVRVCWASGGPVRLNGAYLSAEFPSANYGSVPVDMTLFPAAGDTADFAFQSQLTPTISTPSSWEWPSVSPTSGLRVSVVNASLTQHESYLSFLSGVVFGIAGGALVTLLQELLTPLSRRRDARSGG